MHVYLYSTTVCATSMDKQTAGTNMQTQSFDSQFDNTFDARINSRISNRSDSQAQANTQSSFEFQTPHNRMQRWVCHVSSKTKLKATHKQVMNVKPNTKMSPFDSP